MLSHEFFADGAFRVRIGHRRGLVTATKLRGAFDLIEKAAPRGPQAGLAIPGGLMPELPFSFAHERYSIRICLCTNEVDWSHVAR